MKYLLLVLTVFTFTTPDDPTKIDIKTILATAKNGENIQLNQRNADFIKGMNYELPWLEKLEFRLGVNDFSRLTPQYSVRISPNSWAQMGQQRLYQKAQIKAVEARNDALLQNALAERYKAIVDIYFTEELIKLRHQLDTLLNQKNKAMRGMIQQGLDVKVKDILENENDRNELDRLVLQAQTNLEGNYHKVRQFVGSQDKVTLDFSNFISINQIEKLIDVAKISTPQQLPMVLLRQAQTDLAFAEWRLEQSKNRTILSFLQLGYEKAPKNPLLNDDFGARVGLSIPLTGNTRLKRNDLTIKFQEAKMKEQLEISEQKQALDFQVVTLINLLKQYHRSIEKSENNLANDALKSPKLLAEITALELLDIKLLQQKNRLEIVKTAQNITSEYLKLIEISGLMTAQPFKNYLSEMLEEW
jgi:hypothetical protein